MADEKQATQAKETAPREATDKQADEALQTFFKTGKPPAGYVIRFERRGDEAVPVVRKR